MARNNQNSEWQHDGKSLPKASEKTGRRDTNS